MNLLTQVHFHHQGRWLEGKIVGRPLMTLWNPPRYDILSEGAYFGNISVHDIRVVEAAVEQPSIRMVKG